MKIKNVKLEWYILRYDFNSKKVIMYNVFGPSFSTTVANKIKKGSKDKFKPVTNYKTFKDWIKFELMYYYWSKSEHEIMVSDLFEIKEYKIDGWFQLEPNLDNICNMIIEKMQIKFNN